MSEQVTETEQLSQNLAQIRDLIKAKRLENGGGVLAESLRAAADKIGVSHAALLYILDGTTKALDISTCLGIARYLGTSPLVILRMAGHEDIAEYLVQHMEVPEDDTNPRITQIERAIADLPPDEQNMIVANVRNLARTMREAREKYTAIIEEKPKRRRKKT